MTMTRVKICGIRNEDDLRIAVAAGADAVGFLVGQVHASPSFILPGTAARLATALPPYIQPVLVTHLTEPEEIVDLVGRTGIYTIQLHGGSTPEQVAALRDKLIPQAKLIVAAHLREDKQILDLMDFYSVADDILLDSCLPEERKVGGTGIICDWELAAKFTAGSLVPITLAGGLAADNVADAIRKVKPFAVDANSRLRDAEGRLDYEKAVAFCRTAKLQELD